MNNEKIHDDKNNSDKQVKSHKLYLNALFNEIRNSIPGGEEYVLKKYLGNNIFENIINYIQYNLIDYTKLDQTYIPNDNDYSKELAIPLSADKNTIYGTSKGFKNIYASSQVTPDFKPADSYQPILKLLNLIDTYYILTKNEKPERMLTDIFFQGTLNGKREHIYFNNYFEDTFSNKETINSYVKTISLFYKNIVARIESRLFLYIDNLFSAKNFISILVEAETNDFPNCLTEIFNEVEPALQNYFSNDLNFQKLNTLYKKLETSLKEIKNDSSNEKEYQKLISLLTEKDWNKLYSIIIEHLKNDADVIFIDILSTIYYEMDLENMNGRLNYLSIIQNELILLDLIPLYQKNDSSDFERKKTSQYAEDIKLLSERFDHFLLHNRENIFQASFIQFNDIINPLFFDKHCLLFKDLLTSLKKKDVPLLSLSYLANTKTHKNSLNNNSLDLFAFLFDKIQQDTVCEFIKAFSSIELFIQIISDNSNKKEYSIEQLNRAWDEVSIERNLSLKNPHRMPSFRDLI